MSARRELYLLILHYGLLAIRRRAAERDWQYCALEADHLHNVPELAGGASEEKHIYYLDTEKMLYSEKIAKTEFPRSAYEPLWAELERMQRREQPEADR